MTTLKQSPYKDYDKQVQDYMNNVLDCLKEDYKVIPSSWRIALDLIADNYDIYLKSKALVRKEGLQFFEDIRKLLWAAYNEFTTDKLEKLKKCLPQNMMVKNVNMEELIPTPEKAAIETAYNALQFVHLVNKRNDEDESI